MSYLEKIQEEIDGRNFKKLIQYWEDFCTSELEDPNEFLQILETIKSSDFTESFGPYAEEALPLWHDIQDDELSYQVLKVILDLQTTNNLDLADAAIETLKKRYGDDPKFKERIPLIGLRTRDKFQDAISNYELLQHMDKGTFVFHKGGWGTGEIMDISTVRETVSIEFEHVHRLKHFTFTNAFKTLEPLDSTHFLARRFGNPDQLEKEAREDPLKVVKLLLHDLGPKNAREIKDELSELVIPEEDWTKWWQSARSKLKKDTMIQNPTSINEPFCLRKEAVSHDDLLLQALNKKTRIQDIIQTAYSYIRDFPGVLKNDKVKESLKETFQNISSREDLTPDLQIQSVLFQEEFLGQSVEGKSAKDLIQLLEHPEKAIDPIDILAIKKRAIKLVKEHRDDWPEIYLKLLKSAQQSPTRVYIFEKLNQGETKKILEQKLHELIQYPEEHPDLFFWYFQKAIKASDDKERQCRLLESFFVLLHKIELNSDYRVLTKKMVNHLTDKRYAVVRTLIAETSVEFLKEFLLLASKCHSLTNQDKSILQSLAQVVQPSLGKPKEHKTYDPNIIWTTEAGFIKIRDRIKEIATVEMIENARELEKARELGDLRENAEYKAAKEKRARLQGEMRMLSNQINRARLITKDDIYPDKVSIGSIVEVEDPQGIKVDYTILGPWDANADEYIISFQSKFAQAMIGHKPGETFKLNDINYKILGLRTIF